MNLWKDTQITQKISDDNFKRSKRLDLLNQDLYLNLLQYLIIYKIDDVVSGYLRHSDQSIVNEIEMRYILSKCSLHFIPPSNLVKCLRVFEKEKIVKYDWECSILISVQLLSNFYDLANTYLISKNHKITLTYTKFTNIDKHFNK